jgi:hypothetical protein
MPAVTGSLTTEKEALKRKRKRSLKKTTEKLEIVIYLGVFVHDDVVARKQRRRAVWSSSISPGADGEDLAGLLPRLYLSQRRPWCRRRWRDDRVQFRLL